MLTGFGGMRKMTVTEHPSNIVLIGMPGAGKSTSGVLLAKQTSRGFVDTDIIIQTAQGRSLQDIVDRDGYLTLRKIEEDVLLSLNCHNQVIATGGSAAYSDAAMTHLKSDGLIVFLKVELGILESRIHDYATRGLAKRADQSLADLFEERSVLYQKFADITVDCRHLTPEDVCARIIREVQPGK
jgi:shikimate kinase